jgi:MFS family permease
MSLNKTQRLLLLASICWFFAERVGGDLLDITYAWALFLITSGLLYIFFGKIFSKSKRKKEILVFGYALNTLFTFGYLLVHNSTQLFILQILLAIAEAICTPIWDTIFAKELDEKDDLFFWSVAGGHTHLVSGIAIAIGGLIAYYVSFEVLFVTMGTIQAIATFIQWRLLYVKEVPTTK